MRSPDPSKGHTEIEVEQTSADSYAVNISIDLLDADGETVTGLECWSFPYAFVDFNQIQTASFIFKAEPSPNFCGQRQVFAIVYNTYPKAPTRT